DGSLDVCSSGLRPCPVPVPDAAHRPPPRLDPGLRVRGLRDRRLRAPSGHQVAGGGMSMADDGSAAPQIGLIWAQAHDGVIGAEGTMPWHLPEDLKHFQRTTRGCPVVMGRRTWESVPPRVRPTAGRTDSEITRNGGFAAGSAVRARSLPEALQPARERAHAPAGARGDGSPTIWVIGGGGIYREAIAAADLLVVTEIDLDVDGDTT